MVMVAALLDERIHDPVVNDQMQVGIPDWPPADLPSPRDQALANECEDRSIGHDRPAEIRVR
jgi:hypothetical protein